MYLGQISSSMKTANSLIVENSLFVSVMTDITGKIVINGDDPRWIQLFSIDILPDLMSSPAALTEYCDRWSKTNPNTKNFLHFIEQVSSRVRYLLKKGTTNNESVYEACMGLYIVTVTFQYFIGNLSMETIRNQLLLPLPWPEHIDEKFDYRKKRSGVFHAVENLIIDCIVIIGTMNTELNDVKFFAIELLMCLLSPSLYTHHTCSSPPNVNSSLPQTSTAPADRLHYDIFQKYIIKIAYGDLQYTLANGGFSDNIAVKIVKGLMLNITGVVVPANTAPTLYSRFFGDTNKSNLSEGVLLSKLQNRFKSSSSSSSSKTNNSVGNYFTGLIQYASFASGTSQRGNGELFTTQSAMNQQIFPKYVLSERSMQLILLLLHQQQLVESLGGCSINPFREIFSLLVDESLDTEEHGSEEMMIGLLNVRGPSTSASLHIQKLHLDFRLLFKYFIEFLPNPNIMLLLYTFLSMHPTYLELLRITDNVNEILIKCLYSLFTITDMSPSTENSTSSPPRLFTVDMKHHLSTTVQCLQYILQDTALFHTNSCLLLEVDVSWYPIVGTSKMKMIDLTILLLLRVLKFTIYSIQDYDLLTNILTILKYLFPSIEYLLPRTAEVLVRTLLSCMKRLLRIYNRDQLTNAGPTTRFERSYSDASIAEYSIPSISRASSTNEIPTIAMHPSAVSKSNMVEVPSYNSILTQVNIDLIVLFSSILRLKLSQNCQFLYCLIVEHEKLCSFLSSDLSPLSQILSSFEKSTSSSAMNNRSLHQLLGRSNEDDEDDFNIKHHVGYILHVTTFYFHAIETAKTVQMDDEEYYTAEEAMQMLQNLIEQYEPSKPSSQDPTEAQTESKMADQSVGELSTLSLLELTTEKDFQSVPPHPFYYPNLRFSLEEEISWYKKNSFCNYSSPMSESQHRLVSFLLPYIWTNVLLSTPEFPWRWNKIPLVNDLGMI